MKRIFAITLLIITFTLLGVAQTPCDRYVAGGFSICPPAGWTLEDDKDSTFKKAFSPVTNGSRSNLNFILDVSSVKLKEYADASNNYSLTHVKELGFTSITLLSSADFVTDSNEHGVRSVFREGYMNADLCGMQYVFDVGSKKLLFTFTMLYSDRDANEKIFDAAAKTLKIDH